LKTTWKTQKLSIPVSLAISLGITVILALSACAIVASMVLGGKIREEQTGVILRVILAISVFIAVKINSVLRKEERWMLGGIYTAAVVLLTLILCMILGIKMKDYFTNMLFVLCGVGAGLLIGYKKPNKHAYQKRRYR